MAEQAEIPAPMLDAATGAIRGGLVIDLEWDVVAPIARAALEAANVGALLGERDGLAKDKQILTTALIQQSERITELEAENERLSRWRRLLLECPKGEARQTGLERFAMSDGIQPIIAAWKNRVAELEAELAKHQQSSFHPDWSALEATRESLREYQARVKELEAAAAKTTCPKCGDNRQVWINQITGLLTCHRAGCHTVI